MSGVASIGGVSVEADAHMGEARKPQSAHHLPDQTNSPAPTALPAGFFDSIGQQHVCRQPKSARYMYLCNLTESLQRSVRVNPGEEEEM